MEHHIFQHMETVRGITEQSIRRIPEELSDIVPQGFNNSIRWNLGHIVYIQEKITIGLLGEKMSLPNQYERLFAAGTKPADWNEIPPSFDEISQELAAQKSRLRESLNGRLDEKLLAPFINRMGITFSTVGECLLFSFYHEALHMETIKHLYRFIKS